MSETQHPLSSVDEAAIERIMYEENGLIIKEKNAE
jgi:hypothetical protein